MDPEVSAALAAMQARIDALEARLPPPPKEDATLAARLLPALAGALGSEEFAAADALEYRAIRVVVGDMSAKVLGRFLGRVQGTTVAGWRVQRAGEINKTVLWRVFSSVG